MRANLLRNKIKEITHLNRVVKLADSRIISKKNNRKIDRRLMLGGIINVLSHKFGHKFSNYFIAVKWLNKEKLKKAIKSKK